MRISTKGRYGMRFMLDVALHGHGSTISLKDVARRQQISEKYLWQVVHPLKSAGLVRVTRGAHGGFALAREASEITMKDILDAVEGSSALVECSDCPEKCDRSPDCAMQSIWKDLNQQVAGALSAVNLQAIVDKQKDIASKEAADFVI